MKFSKIMFKVLYLFASSFLISVPAFFNNYPLIYHDSSHYIIESINLMGYGTNPIGYPLFIRAFSWKFSLWPVVIAQAFIINILIYSVIRSIYQDKPLYKLHLFVVFLLSFLTGISWISSFIMADVFIPIAIMSFYLFINDVTKWYVKVFALICIGFSAIAHFIIPLILLGLIIIFTVWRIIWKKFRLKGFFLKIGAATLIIISLMIFDKNYNDIMGYEKAPSISHVLMMARLMENGILDEFLANNCQDSRYSLCNLKGKFPNTPAQFVWSEDGPFTKTGGWAWSKEEYQEIIYRIFTSPYYVSKFTFKSFISTIKQLYTFKIRVPKFDANDAIKKTIHDHFIQEEKEFYRSLQATNFNWETIPVNNFYYLTCILSVFIIFYYLMVLNTPGNHNMHLLILVFLLGIIINAFIAGSFSNVVPRYQARVNWLAVLVAILILYENRGAIYYKVVQSVKFSK